MDTDVDRNPVLEKVRSELLRAARQGEPRRRMRRRLVVVLIGLTALAGASAASAITRTGPLAHVLAGSDVPLPVPRHPVPTDADGQCAELKNVADGRAEPTVKRVDPRLREMLGVFRRPQRPQEAVSNCGIELEDGQNFTLGRIVALPGGDIAFVWPAQNAVCVGVLGLGGCPDVQVLKQHGVAIGGGYNLGVPRGMMRVFGVARDDVSRLIFTLPDDRELTTPIVDNVFSLLLPIEKITAERVDDDGSRHAVPGVPDFTADPPDSP
jgi:hypothetical protein